eukprot:TRINITY_DN23176_c0_g1_i1.p1 TRINITY_DN23176_c0_g1~~TRINITY_DN23176_c0_g1_i1.p1  ORF type:complete len:218 (+),score=18.07 TRINITY_DN23176_c0_g1_i1:136-789(+)
MLPNDCAQDDAELAQWTLLRYLVIAGIIVYRVSIRVERNRGDSLLQLPMKFFQAGFIFATSEGVGMLVYFTVSAVMDNTAIFLDHSGSNGLYCAYVKMVALYSMALVTFLPTCWFAYKCQGTMYDGGGLAVKFLFICIMVIITMVFFTARVLLVHKSGWAELIDTILTPMRFKVYIAILVPPAVDAVQSSMLILASRFASSYSLSATESDDCGHGIP